MFCDGPFVGAGVALSVMLCIGLEAVNLDSFVLLW